MTGISPAFLCIVLVCSTLAACASGSRVGSDAQPIVRVASVSIGGRAYPYAVYTPPNYDATLRWPAILFLHGSGESGDNGTRQMVVGLPKDIMWDSARWPYVVIMPQKPDQDSQWEDHTPAVLAILDQACAEYSIDPTRVILTGLSQGGHGCWTINAAAPGRFAALAPVCGYSTRPAPGAEERFGTFDAQSAEVRRLIEAARGVPVWIFHGEADTVVPVEQSNGMAEALRAAGGDVRLTIYPGVGHGSWEKAYSDPALREWFAKAGK